MKLTVPPIPPIPNQLTTAISCVEQDSSWDAFLAERGGNHHLQCSQWAAVKKVNDWNAKRITLSNSQSVVGGAQILIRDVRYFGKIAYVPKGPVYRKDNPQIIDSLIQQLKNFAKTERINGLIVQPFESGIITESLANHGFRNCPIETSPTATVILDIRSELDDILAKMSKGMRNKIRRGQTRGIECRQGGKTDLPAFHQLLMQTAQRRRFTIFDLNYFEHMWDTFSPTNSMQLFIAEYQGEPVAAQFCINRGNTIIAKQIGWSGGHSKRHPNEALDWYTIQWAKQQGYEFYDLEGISRTDAESIVQSDQIDYSSLAGPTQYKIRLGGEVTILPTAFCFFTNPLLHSLYSRIGSRLARTQFMQKTAGRFRTG
ncbi:MAG: peptidoglycan bridge formation glycyltransferase FemA/FemB family protein [Planctomycetaceae bacterium]|nr:peptidoglycan bridge formation glycyltransferase FemA/FemB family protein [Planctomycetaceae bacterium]